MKELFVPYEKSMELKELGFDELCLGRWLVITELEKPTGEVVLQIGLKVEDYSKNQCAAPTFSQAFKWFREKYELEGFIEVKNYNHQKYYFYTINGKWPSSQPAFDTPEEAELACIDEFIEIVKKSIQICK